MRSGFSLVELSIVLVILGLLTGGILTGQNLIRAAELRSVTTEFSAYQTAVNTFKDKYFAIPGDMSNATNFWGSTTCPATAGTGTQTCNGNGDGSIFDSASVNASEYAEKFMFWQHLANAGLVEGSFSGIAGADGRADANIDDNVPRSKLGSAGWSVNAFGTLSGNGFAFNGDYGNTLIYGSQQTGNNATHGPILSPEEAWNIDTKTDDGNPALGRLVVRNRVDCSVAANGTALTSGAGDAGVLDAQYNLQLESVVCAFLFRRAL